MKTSEIVAWMTERGLSSADDRREFLALVNGMDAHLRYSTKEPEPGG